MRSAADQILQIHPSSNPPLTSIIATCLRAESAPLNRLDVSTHPHHRTSTTRGPGDHGSKESDRPANMASLCMTTMPCAPDLIDEKLTNAPYRTQCRSPEILASSPILRQPASSRPRFQTHPHHFASPPTSKTLPLSQKMIFTANTSQSDNGHQTCRSFHPNINFDLSANTVGGLR